ncbi:epoxide hydrolase N-terminal domain-containing protein [Rhodococcus opacus]|uniref:epoxide hydrolase N-terminal domain-containing protein n=1 Tax=Rhodococcus opacus TaxID=37919 RepID=UPI001C455482|nr:epoxide hydrolase N-terminal domain-containing protein [Rhodococcus opacus]
MDHGTSLADLRSLTDYWQNDFDWRAWEAKLNSFPQFPLPVRGIEVYAVVQARPTAFRPRRNHRILQCVPMIDTPRTSGATRHYGNTNRPRGILLASTPTTCAINRQNLDAAPVSS